MPSRRHIELQIGIDSGSEELGVWCDACALPSGHAIVFLMTLNDRPHGVFRVSECLDCGRCWTIGS